MKLSARRSKQASRARIVEAGARAIRRSGYDGVGIAAIMKQAGLTHGSFYTHFSSREAMLAELADHAGAEAIALFTRIAEAAPAGQSTQALLHAYLSRQHLEHPEDGCPIAALGSEMPRQAPPVRQAITSRIKEMIDVVSSQVTGGDEHGGREHALVITATMIGAVVLARAIDDQALSEAVLAAARAHLLPHP